MWVNKVSNNNNNYYYNTLFIPLREGAAIQMPRLLGSVSCSGTFRHVASNQGNWELNRQPWGSQTTALLTEPQSAQIRKKQRCLLACGVRRGAGGAEVSGSKHRKMRKHDSVLGPVSMLHIQSIHAHTLTESFTLLVQVKAQKAPPKHMFRDYL